MCRQTGGSHLTAPHSLTPAERREAFERAYWDWAEYLTRKAAEKAAQQA